VAEDWRVTVTFAGELGEGALARIAEPELEQEAKRSIGSKVAVSGDSRHLFLYADTEAAARDAQQVLVGLLATDGIEGEFALARWHPIEEEWEPADVPLPSTPEEIEREHEELEEQETAESEAAGYAEWEVRLDLPSHHEAEALAEKLDAEGYTTTRRWKYLLVGAANEDDAAELADRLREESPPGTDVHIQGGGEAAWEGMEPNPFAWFGGLGG
jgi:hypothetical protein